LTGTETALVDQLRALVRDVPDFPRAGILFRDITSLLRDPRGFGAAVDMLADAHSASGVEAVVGVESRGFILGGAVAYRLGAGFVPVRKQGRLPAAKVSVAYQLEYGAAELEMHTDAIAEGQRVLIVDDLLATGGTAAAAVSLVDRLGGHVVGIAFLIELESLGGAAALDGRPYTSIIRF